MNNGCSYDQAHDPSALTQGISPDIHLPIRQDAN
jgi:hypothetical protein